MPELHLRRTGDLLTITIGEHHTSIPWKDVAPNEHTGQHIYEAADDYGRSLFEKLTRDEDLRSALVALPANKRLALVTDDPEIAAIPWEYLRDSDNILLASRLNLVRYVPLDRSYPSVDTSQALTIVATPVSPVDEPRVLNTEREWQRLVEAVKVPRKVLTLTRVRPPTLAQMEQALPGEGMTIVHFMGHSGTLGQKSVLMFEDKLGRSQTIDASYFTSALDEHVFLVVLNSCLSAAVTRTGFGNIAQAVVRQGVPYALGMQFVLFDDAALEMSKTLYSHLLQGRNVEEAIRRVRREVEQNSLLHHPLWVAGIPVLYTHLREPAPALRLEVGQPTISPDPKRLQATCDMTALSHTEHLVGRSDEITRVLRSLLAPAARGFVMLHGLGGIGKTTLARAIGERVSWYYNDRVLALSFETFAKRTLENQLLVDEQFVDRFYNQLAHFYGIDPTKYGRMVELQRAILQQRTHIRSLLILDNIETLIDAQKHSHPVARMMAIFISRLKEGDGAVLLTSRILPPLDWGECEIIPIAGLSNEMGGKLFLSLLPPRRRPDAYPDVHEQISQKVQGHPLSIRLLAGRFAHEQSSYLSKFLTRVDAELRAAEQRTPSSLEEPERQATLYACINYSINCLTHEQEKVLHTASIFRAPFLPEFMEMVLDDTQQTCIHLQDLVSLGLLERSSRTLEDGVLELLELHSVLRWYIQHHRPSLDSLYLERYGLVYKQLAKQSYMSERGYDRSACMRYLVQQSLPDCEAALEYLAPSAKSDLAYYLTEPYRRLGQIQHALALCELVLEIQQEHANEHTMSFTNYIMGELLTTADRPQEAMAFFQQALNIQQSRGDLRDISIIQNAMADVERNLGHYQEALALYEQSLQTKQQIGDEREIALTQSSMAHLFVKLNRVQEAKTLYEQSLPTFQKLREVRVVALIQKALADLHMQQWRYQDALPLYERSLQTLQELKDLEGVATTQLGLGQLLFRREELSRALPMLWEAYKNLRDNNYSAEMRTAQKLIVSLKEKYFLTNMTDFDTVWAQDISEPQPDWLQMVQGETPVESKPQYLPQYWKEVLQTASNFINADSWKDAYNVVEKQQAVLFRPETETFFEQNIAHARAVGDRRVVVLLQQHRNILRKCKTIGITAAFEPFLTERQASPFGEELILRCIAALMDGPREKVAHRQYLAVQMSKTADSKTRELLQIIMQATYENNLLQLGENLSGVYRQAWEDIIVGVETGGANPLIFEELVQMTRNVLGPDADHYNEWRNSLANLLKEVTEQEYDALIPLLVAIIKLLDADGNIEELGEKLTGVCAKTWRRIVG